MKRMSRLFAILALGAIASSSAKPSRAQMLYDLAAGESGSVGTGNGGTVGFEFTLTASKTLTKLGLWDDGGNGLNSSHEVGIWDSSAALVANTTVTNATSTVEASASALGRWLFEAITPVLLPAGVYRMGMLITSSQETDNRRYAIGTTFMTDASQNGFRMYTNGDTLTRPTTISITTGAYGPNAMFAPSSVPEASSFALLLAGAAPLGLIAKKRLRQKG